MSIEKGTRKVQDVKLKEIYILTGKVSFKETILLGLSSIIRDPLFLLVKFMPGPLGFKLRQLWYKRTLGAMGRGCLIEAGANISGPENVYLDEFVLIDQYAQLVAPEGYIRIGRRCHIAQFSIILGHGCVEIGDYAAVGGTILSASDWPRNGKRVSGPMVPVSHRNLLKKKVVIGKDALIGRGSVIFPGVTVGEGAIVAVNSVVISDIKPWTVVMGSPAKVIGKRDNVKLPDI